MVRPPRQLPAPRYGGEVGPQKDQDETATMVVTKEQIFDKKPEPAEPTQAVEPKPALDWAQQLRLDMRYHADG